MVVTNSDRISIVEDAIGDTGVLASKSVVNLITTLTSSNANLFVQVERLPVDLEACKLEVLVLKRATLASQPHFIG